MTLIDLKTSYGTAWVNPDFVSSIDFQTDNCFVRCDGTDYRVTHEVGHELLAKINGEKSATPTAQPANVQVRSIKSIERTSTWSNSAQKHFDFWRCVMDNGDKVNIFNHPDESRNTFKIVKAQGWEDVFNDTDEGIEYELLQPVPVAVAFDGQWYSLVDMQVIGQYMQAYDLYTESEIIPHYDDDFDPNDEVDPFRDRPFEPLSIDFDDDDESDGDDDGN